MDKLANNCILHLLGSLLIGP